jgi:tRNA nucleotidyltransferase (CCA-adding enzyme)
MSYLDRTNTFVNALGAPEAYLVGGAVRDRILGRRVKDADYVVRLPMDDLKRALRKTGADFGPLALRSGKIVGYRATKRGIGAVEIVLPRIERKKPQRMDQSLNDRQQFDIVVDPSVALADDAVRRDFTINAIYQNAATGEIIDPLGGRADIEHKLLRTTHPESFADDPLRILRALRFVSVLGFDLAPTTMMEMQRLSDAVTGLTGKGVSGTALDELQKILMGRNVAKALRLARDSGVLATLLPELGPMLNFEQGSSYHDMTTDEHTFTALDWAARANLNLRTRMALLFHDAGKPHSAWKGRDGYLHFYEPSDETWEDVKELLDNQSAALGWTPDGCVPLSRPKPQDHAVVSARLLRHALKRLNAEAKLINQSATIVENHMLPLTMKVKPTKVRKWRCEFGDDLLADLFKHRLADCMGKAVVDYESISAIARMEKIREDAVEAGVPSSPKDLKDMGLVNGHDLIEMGIEGQKIGAVLNQLLHEVVSDPSRMDRDWLLGRAAKLGGVA